MKSRITIFLLATISLLWACTAGGGSIYRTLENEVKTTDNTLKNEIPIHDVALHGDGNYYAAGGRIWRGTPDAAARTVNWDTTTPVTPPVDGALCNALVEFQGVLYGGFINQPGSLGLYKANGASPAQPTSFASGQIADPLVANKQVVLLAVVNAGADLIVGTASTGDPFTYDLMRSTDGTAYSSLLAATTTKAFTGVAHTSTSGKYWAVSGTSLYSGTAGTLVEDTRLVKSTAAEVLTSVFSDDGASRLYVTSNLGFVYYSIDEGATWTSNAAAQKVGDTVVSFLTVAGGSGQSKMLVGSDGVGYYILDTAVSPPTLARFAESTIGLYTASIRRFLIDTTVTTVVPYRLFACTTAKGLWRNESFDPANCSVGSWVQE